MWLCTKLGFFSIVQKTPTEVHVRARAKQDLENLKAHCIGRVGTAGSGCVSNWKIHRTIDADYRYRVVIAPRHLPDLMSALAASLDYSNFKGVIASTADQRDKLAIYSAFHHDLEHWQHRTDQLSPR